MSRSRLSLNKVTEIPGLTLLEKVVEIELFRSSHLGTLSLSRLRLGKPSLGKVDLVRSSAIGS